MSPIPSNGGRGTRLPGGTPRRSSAVPARVHDSFAALLTERQAVDSSELQSARRYADECGLALHDAVVALGFMEERPVYELLATAAALPFADARRVVPSGMALKVVPLRLARRHQVVPLSLDDRRITYLTADPYDLEAERDISFTSGRTPTACLACPTDLRTALHRIYPDALNLDSLLTQARTRNGSTVELVDTVSVDTASESAVIDLCNMLIARAVDGGASDLHLDPSDTGILVRLRVGGVLEPALAVPRDVAPLVRNRFKVMARADIAVRHRPQDGAFTIRAGGRRIDVRLSTLPTTSGEKIVMRLIDSQSELQALEMLGYEDELMTRFRRTLDRPDGLVLVTGPTGSGKTTALYAALRHLRTGRTNIVSVEDPVERTLAGVNQIPVNTRAGATFASVLRSVLRQDPDVLMVGEIRDQEVAAIVGQAAYTGHLVLTSVHTIDAATAISRLLNLGLEPFRIAESLTGILAQRLVRRVCHACRGRNNGCPRCNFTGFGDRVPVAELLTPTDEIRAVIARNGTAAEIRQAMRAAGLPSMRDHARTLVASGAVAEREIARVLGSDDDISAAAGPQPTVLVADDDAVTRTLVRLLLEREGYTVVEAETGRDAVDLAVRHRPELVVMDLNMPHMDGYGAIAAIRRLPALASTAIVVVTAEDGAEVEGKVLTLGADDYIVKPFEPALLTARVRAVFNRQRLAA